MNRLTLARAYSGDPAGTPVPAQTTAGTPVPAQAIAEIHVF